MIGQRNRVPDSARRRFLRCGVALAAGLPLAGLWPRPSHAAGASLGGRVLVLLELNGGNDGLNTVVPYDDRLYDRARPSLAVPRDRVLQLDERLGLNAALEPLMPLWRDGELAIALGLGYQPPNRSHFRSIEIWNTASDSDEVLHDGWVARVLGEAPGPDRDDLAADGLVLGGVTGPLAGGRLRTVVMREPERFLRQAAKMTPMGTAAANPALSHVLRVREEIHASASVMESRLQRAPALDTRFPQGPLGRQLAVAARLIAAGVPLGAIKVSQTGYDTHAQQAGRHPRLLEQLAASLAAFREALVGAGLWDRVLVMTYAEFGRRVAENASNGTDHGTAAPHFILGGRVRGGLYGMPPALGDLDGGDLRPTMDFRRLYATAAQGWWGLPPSREALAGQRPLPCLS